MAAGQHTGKQRRVPSAVEREEAPTPAPALRRRRPAADRAAGVAAPEAVTRHPSAPRRSAAGKTSANAAAATLPSVAPCDDLSALQALTPALAREHVEAYLHAAMPAAEAAAFEAKRYRWELHLVPLDQISLIRAVELSPSRLRRYRAALRRGTSCAPLIGLGGDGHTPAESVLLCDGYHRAVALRDIGIHFAWVWLAVGLWTPARARRRGRG
ncbi:MAG: hypothetical protein ACHQ4H_00935 [Ktedonobacterales bacterium]